MRKVLAILLLSLYLQDIYSQIIFPNDSSYSPLSVEYIKEIDSVFKHEKNSDFEFRFWTTTYKEYYRIQLFSLSLKNNKWAVRFYEEGWKTINDSSQIIQRYFEEKKIPDTSQKVVQKLLSLLNKNNYLTNPMSEDLFDRKGYPARWGICHCYYYNFELISTENKRTYSYACPGTHTKKFKYIRTFKKIVNITKAIFEFCGLKDYKPC